MKITFITGNQDKADYLARHLGFHIDHVKIDLDEIQSLSLEEVARHKAVQAYDYLQTPVLVEDVGLSCAALNGLPGPFIKWFASALGHEKLCHLLDPFDDRSAVAVCVFAYYDGKEIVTFEGSLRGTIADEPRGSHGFGWDPIFIPEGYEITRAEMNNQDDEKTYATIKPFAALREFLQTKVA